MAEGTSVGSLFYDLTIDDGEIQGQLDSADKKVGDFADKLKGGLTKAAAGFAVVGAGLTVISKQATDFAVDAVKSAKSLGTQIGVSAEDASKLTAAFGRMGLSVEATSQMFGIFSKNIVAATKDFKDQSSGAAAAQIAIEKTQRSIAATTAEIQKSGDKTGDLTFKLKDLNNTLSTQQAALSSTTNAFQKLGLTTLDSSGNQKDFNTILFEVADKFKTLPNGIDKTALAMELFGRSGKDMIKVLNLGSGGIKDLEEQADKLGLTLTSQNIAAVNDYIQSQKDLKQSTDALKLAVGTTTAPVLADFNRSLNDVLLSLMGTDGAMKTVTVDILAFGGPVASGIASLFGFAAAVVQVGEAIGFVLLGSISLAAIAFIGLGVAIFEMIQHVEELGVVFVIITDQIQMKLHALWDWVSQNWPLLLAILIAPFAMAAIFIWDQLEGVRQAIAGWASGAAHWLYDAGVSIIEGLINGIKDKIGDAVNAVKGAGQSIINSARDVLGWHSPSTVFIEAGKSIADGLALGISRNANTAMSALNGLAGSVIAPAINLSPAGGGSGSASAGGGSGDTFVSIGQVNDKSDADYILQHMDRDQSLELNGFAPQRRQ